MNYTEIWNYLVEEVERNKYEQEDKIHILWQSYFSNPLMFGYNGNDVDSKRSLHIGSTNREIPDLILKKDKSDLFIIELKRYSLHKNEDFEKQLLNYMSHTDLRLSVGILICSAIYVYYYDFASSKEEKLKIEFIKNNINGAKFIELFSKQNFNEIAIKQFIENSNQSQNNILSIKKQITSELLKQLLKEHFLKTFSESDFEKAISEKKISIEDLSDHNYKNKNKNSNHNNFVSKLGCSHNLNETVSIKGIKLPLYRDSKTTIQDFVKETLQVLFDNNLLNSEEIKRLQDKSYSQQNFGIQHPLLQKEWKNCVISGHSRYWNSNKIGDFYVCSQWWKEKTDLYDEKLSDWLKTLQK